MNIARRWYGLVLPIALLIGAAPGAAGIDPTDTGGPAGAGPQIGVKWPNDLVGPDGRKLAGVLAEADLSSTAPGVPAPVVVGIGINVNEPAKLYYSNLVMGANLMEAARLAKVEKFAMDKRGVYRSKSFMMGEAPWKKNRKEEDDGTSKDTPKDDMCGLGRHNI